MDNVTQLISNNKEKTKVGKDRKSLQITLVEAK